MRPSSRHTFRPTTSRACPIWSPAPATAYLPEGAGVDFDHHPLADAEIVHVGNTEFKAIATPGHAQAHHAYLVTDHARADDPWMVLTGDALLVGDAGRPDLHAHGDHSVEEMALALIAQLTERLLSLPDHLLVYPAHYAGSVCGRSLSATRLNHRLRAPPQPSAPTRLRRAFVETLVRDIPPAPERQAEIVATNRAGRRTSASTAA